MRGQEGYNRLDFSLAHREPPPPIFGTPGSPLEISVDVNGPSATVVLPGPPGPSGPGSSSWALPAVTVRFTNNTIGTVRAQLWAPNSDIKASTITSSGVQPDRISSLAGILGNLYSASRFKHWQDQCECNVTVR